MKSRILVYLAVILFLTGCNSKKTETKAKLIFPKDFAWGTASAAYQVEG